MKKKNILISAGGTSTAWHILNVLNKYYKDYFTLFVCDINPEYLIPSSLLADKFIKVSPISSESYKKEMLEIFEKNRIDIFVPLIDYDLHEFLTDDEQLLSRKVHCTGVSKASSDILKSKVVWSKKLEENGIPVPFVYNDQELKLSQDLEFFSKPIIGFGSKGAQKVSKQNALNMLNDKQYIIQQICTSPEITVEVFNDGKNIKSICRERIEVKSGVSTKSRVFFDEELHLMASNICEVIDMPVSFCFQVMKDEMDRWVVTDLNPRLGAGTSMSTTCGFSLVRASIVKWGDLPEDPLQYLDKFEGSKYVTRVYEDILLT